MGRGQRINKETNDFIRKASIFCFGIHFPEATLDLVGLFAIPIRLEKEKKKKRKDRIMEILQVTQFFLKKSSFSP